MSKTPKNAVLILIPMICALAVGTYFGYEQYLAESESGHDSSDAIRWAFIGSLFYVPIGLIIGLVIDFFIGIIMNIISEKRQQSNKTLESR